MSTAYIEANYENRGEIDVSNIDILPNSLAEAIADSRERRNLTGPFSSATEAIASMLKEG